MGTPEFFHLTPQFTPDNRLSDAKNGDHFIVEELLDIPNDDIMAADGGFEAAMSGATAYSSAASAVDTSCNSSLSGGSSVEPDLLYADVGGVSGFADGHLWVPYDELAELEWLSNFTEESLSSEDVQKLHLIQGIKARTNEPPSDPHQYPFQHEAPRACPILRPEVSVPAKARSKRSRAAPDDWTSRLLAVAPPAVSSSPSDNATGKKMPAKELGADNSSGGGDGRKCLHCSTDKTPQWRTGPLGPKTLCNACGVRYKSGRLVPEYRPAASPTFVLTKHSNSHRKVLELRRQKETGRAQQQQFLHHQNLMLDLSNGDDYLIHQHIGPDFRQLI